MAFDIRNLSEVRALGNNRWHWNYRTADSLATVLGANYFSTVNGLSRLHSGDVLDIVANSDAESQQVTVSSVAGGSVALLQSSSGSATDATARTAAAAAQTTATAAMPNTGPALATLLASKAVRSFVDFTPTLDGTTDDAVAWERVRDDSTVRYLLMPPLPSRVSRMVTLSRPISIIGQAAEYASGLGSVIVPDEGVCALKLDTGAHSSRISDVLFKGQLRKGGAGSGTLGGCGLWVGGVNQPVLDHVAFKDLDIGLAVDASQNAEFRNCGVDDCKIGMYVTNGARNIFGTSLRGRMTQAGAAAALVANRPNNRLLLIGRLTYNAGSGINRYVPNDASGTIFNRWPSKIQLLGGIWEELPNDSYLIEINGAYDNIILDGVELTDALTALLRVSQTESDPNNRGQIILRNWTAQSSFAAGSKPPTVSAVSSSLPVIVEGTPWAFVMGKPSYGPNIRRSSYPDQSGAFIPLLDGPVHFRDEIGGWVPMVGGGNTSTATWNSTNKTMDIVLQDTVWGLFGPANTQWDITNWPPSQRAKTWCRLAGYCTAISGTVSVYVEQSLSPFTTLITTISATGKVDVEFQAPANAMLSLRVVCGAGTGATASFSRLMLEGIV